MTIKNFFMKFRGDYRFLLLGLIPSVLIIGADFPRGVAVLIRVSSLFLIIRWVLIIILDLSQKESPDIQNVKYKWLRNLTLFFSGTLLFIAGLVALMHSNKYASLEGMGYGILGLVYMVAGILILGSSVIKIHRQWKPPIDTTTQFLRDQQERLDGTK